MMDDKLFDEACEGLKKYYFDHYNRSGYEWTPDRKLSESSAGGRLVFLKDKTGQSATYDAGQGVKTIVVLNANHPRGVLKDFTIRFESDGSAAVHRQTENKRKKGTQTEWGGPDHRKGR